MRVLMPSVAVFFLSVWMASGGAQTADDRLVCELASGDAAVAACGRAIASGKYVGRDLAQLHDTRGGAYHAKGDYDRAIADYDEAIRLDPTLAVAYYNRGVAYQAKGEHDRAIVDFSETIRLDPNLASAFLNRGAAYGAKGDHDRAIADFSEAARLDPSSVEAFHNRGKIYGDKGDYERAVADYSEAIRLDPKSAISYRQRGYAHYNKGDFSAAAADLLRANDLAEDAYAMLWRFLARGRLGQDGTAELSGNAARLKTNDWPRAVIEFYLGERTLEGTRVAASEPDEKCEIAFYVGQWQLLRGDKLEAKAPLQNAVDICPKDFIEYAGAIAELKRLNPP